MANYDSARGARILIDLNNAFRRDPFIDEYDFLPVLEAQKNCSPLILQEHKLGLELWSVKVLYQHAYNRLLSCKQGGKKSCDAADLAFLSRAVLMVNPECATVWNIRKKLVLSDDLPVSDDLKLGALILTKFPKSPETFSHRKWLLQRLLPKYLPNGTSYAQENNSAEATVYIEAINVNIVRAVNDNQPAVLPGLHAIANHRIPMRSFDGEVWKEEFSVCEKSAERYPCNYAAWAHRMWVVEQAYHCDIQILLSELSRTRDWVSRHVSDHSGFHYRQFLLSSLVRQQQVLQKEFTLSVRTLLHDELALIIKLIRTYPCHETLWYHRRYSIHKLYEICKGCVSLRDMASTPTDHGDVHSTNHDIGQKKTRLDADPSVLLSKEIDGISQNEVKSKYKHEKYLAQRYIDWLSQYL